MTTLSLLLLCFVLWTVIQQRPHLSGLTAHTAGLWAVAALTTAVTGQLLHWTELTGPAVTSAVHYLAATLLLAPLIDVLGARDPGHRAWPWFVVLPMIVVLQWPVISHLISEQIHTPVEIPLPASLGFLLVLIMGTGNYFGTANTAACLTGGTGTLLFVLPVTVWMDWPGQGAILAGSLLLAISALLIEGRLQEAAAAIESGPVESSHAVATAHQRLWLDFRDIYGLVWAKRVVDRINQFAQREQWNVEMTLEGFHQPGSSDGRTSPPPRALEIQRWVLRRFVSDDVLQRYGIRTDAETLTTNS